MVRSIKSQDTDILLSLVYSDGSTAYMISKETKISVPQVMYRLNKLVESKAVSSEIKGDKTYYYVHPALKSEEVILKITSLLQEVVNEVEKVAHTEEDGMKTIIELIISNIELEPKQEDIVIEENDIAVAEDEMIKTFRERLNLHAKEYNLKITNIKGWTEPKIVWMALNDWKCGCAPDKRKCPCKEGLIEIEKKGKCLCSVFERGEFYGR